VAPSCGHAGAPRHDRSSVRVIPASALQSLPPIQQARPQLQDIATNLAESAPVGAADEDREYDVFISHATEDKDAVVRPLAHALRENGVSVWYDEFELKVGDSLRRKIDAGIAKSLFGLVVLSPGFFARGWAQYELDGLVTMSVSGKQVLLPIWHGVSKDEVLSRSPTLADKVALRTSDYSIEEIAAEIASVVHPDESAEP
jgi:TIR domain-containing protein